PRHIAREDHRVRECSGELAHVLLLPLALEGEDEAGALARKRPGDRPCDAPAVRHPHHERRLPVEEPAHRSPLPEGPDGTARGLGAAVSPRPIPPDARLAILPDAGPAARPARPFR